MRILTFLAGLATIFGTLYVCYLVTYPIAVRLGVIKEHKK